MIGERFIRAAGGSPSAAFRCLGAFAHGLFAPTGMSFACTLALVMAGVVAVNFYPWEKRSEATNPADWAHGELTDEHRRVSVLTAKGTRAFPLNSPQRPLIVFIGPSFTREALPITGVIEARLLHETGRLHDVLLLGAYAMPTGVKSAVIEKIGTDFDGTIIVGVNRHCFGATNHRNLHIGRFYGLESKFIDDDLNTFGRAPWVWQRRYFVIDGFGGFQNTFVQRAPWKQHQYVGMRSVSEAIFNGAYTSVEFDEMERELAIFALALKAANQAKRAKIIFVDCPFADDFAPAVQTSEWKRQRDEFERRMTEWSQANGVGWWSFSSEMPLTRADFVDQSHMLTDRAHSFYLRGIIRRLRAMEERTAL